MIALLLALALMAQDPVVIDAGPDPAECIISAGPNDSIHPQTVLRASSELGVIEWPGVETEAYDRFLEFRFVGQGTVTVEVIPGDDGITSLPFEVSCIPIPPETTTTTEVPETTTTTTTAPTTTTTEVPPPSTTTVPPPPPTTEVPPPPSTTTVPRPELPPELAVTGPPVVAILASLGALALLSGITLTHSNREEK